MQTRGFLCMINEELKSYQKVLKQARKFTANLISRLNIHLVQKNDPPHFILGPADHPNPDG